MKNFKKLHVIVSLLLSIFILSACGLMDLYSEIIGGDQPSVEEQVQATLTAIASEKAVEPTNTVEIEIPPTATPVTPTTTQQTQGIITGEIAYPSEFLPPQRVVAFDTVNLNIYFVTEIQSGNTYILEVPPGTYYVLSYLINPSQLGTPPDFYAAFSQAVVCGLAVGCEDHSLVAVEVQPGETVMDINPIDWYRTPGEDEGWPTDPINAGTGSITGRLGYPSEYIPPLRVVAFDVYSQNYYYVETLLNQDTYEITDLPAGTYYVLAYVREEGPGISAGYSYAVPCGLTVECSDHSLIGVMVYPGEVTGDIDPIDYYAQPGEVDWPDDPTQ